MMFKMAIGGSVSSNDFDIEGKVSAKQRTV